MKPGPRYRVFFRRRREGKTDYYKRLKLLKSGKPRFIVRITSNRVRAMISKPSTIGDYTLIQVGTEHLRKHGWKGGARNTPAAYLVGLLCGKKAMEQGIEECVFDIGLHSPQKGVRAFAVLKGALDSGLQIPHDPEVLPENGRITGRHIAEYAQKLKENSEGEYKRRFSQYLKRGLAPEKLEEHFNEIKNNILGAGGGDEKSG